MSDRFLRHNYGCLPILGMGLVVIILLLVNSLLVKAFLDSSAYVAEELRITQTLQFGLPVVMIFFEYWLYDFFRRNR